MPSDLFHYRQFTIRQDHAAMKVGTDSDLLGTLSVGGSKILDIGTGTGVISLMLAQRYPEAHITAIEIDENAVLDARYNFEQSKWHDRLEVHHVSLQEYLLQDVDSQYDSVVCNPPYFDRSLECPNQGRARARHTSSLPFEVLVEGAYRMLKDDGYFSVCIPPEVLENFEWICRSAGFSIAVRNVVKSVPEKEPKRYVVVCRKGAVNQTEEPVYCMRNSDRTRSDWYQELMKDFLICGNI